jgi:hypothetical protein
MVKSKTDFLARKKNDQLLREITTLYVPNANSSGGFFNLEKNGRVIVKARKKSSRAKRIKLRKMQAGHGRSDPYLETVRILAGRDKSIL